MNGNRLALRVDANREIGLGHLMRSIALAEAWREAGGAARFLISRPDEKVRKLVARREFEIEAIDAEPGSARDAEVTSATCREFGATWLAADGYSFDDAWFAAARDVERSTLAIDDLDQVDGDLVDLALNQNLCALPDDAMNKRLRGTRFALLRPEFNRASKGSVELQRSPRVLVLGGGSDVGGGIARVLAGLAGIESRLQIRVVAGPLNESDAAQQAGLNIQSIRNPGDLAPHLAWADLAITAAGATCWELCRLGVPMLVYSVAANQLPNAEALAKRGAAIDLGDVDSLNESTIARRVIELVSNSERRAKMSRVAAGLVDGQGAGRVVRAMLARSVRLRAARREDCRLSWQWANDSDTRRGSFREARIGWAEHVAWFRRRLVRRDGPILVATDGFDRPWGQIRCEHEAGEALVAIVVAPWARGEQRARKLLRAGSARFFRECGTERLVALVKPENERSRRLFHSAGYTLVGSTTVRGALALRFELSRAEFAAKRPAEIAAR